MHFSNLLFLVGNVAIIAAAEAELRSITFYNDANWQGNPITQTVKVGECDAIPDSNAKGDRGSSVSFEVR